MRKGEGGVGDRRQLVLINREGDDPSSDSPLGTLREVLAELARFNTAGDSLEDTRPDPEAFSVRLFGPGMYVDVPTGQAEVRQVMIDCYDADLAGPVLVRLCRDAGWRMQDIETGQMFG